MAEIGNKNAEKWTEEVALSFISEVTDILLKPQQYNIGGACVEAGSYPQIWSYLTEKFNDNDSVFEAIKRAEGIVEQRIIKDTMTGEAKSQAMAIFLLKNKYGYKDEFHNQQKHSIGYTKKELQEAAKYLKDEY